MSHSSFPTNVVLSRSVWKESRPEGRKDKADAKNHIKKAQRHLEVIQPDEEPEAAFNSKLCAKMAYVSEES